MSREICKYYMHGACNKGAACRFSHDIQAPKSTVCSYYLAGNCSYGDKCRYDHVRPAGIQGPPAGLNRPAPPMTVPRPNVGGNISAGAREFVPLNAMMGGMSVGGARPYHPSAQAPAWQPAPPGGAYPPQGGGDEQDDWGYEDEDGNWVSFNEGSGKEEVEFLKSQLPSEDDFLDGLGADTGPHREEQDGGGDEWGYYDDAGNWVGFGGEVDSYLHAQQGGAYGGQASDGTLSQDTAAPDAFTPPPVSQEEAERLRIEDERTAASAKVECGICLEIVHEKPRIGERRFGLLSGCDHPFCLGCIRDWRDGGVVRDAAEQTSGALEQARKCPLCRTQSHFTIPSTHWPRNAEEKDAIIGEYRARMDRIPCRNFDYGDGHCPFGSSCFYAHVYRDGTRESHEIRKTTDAEGNLKIVGGARLSDWLDTKQGRRAFR